jgi:hypothetical protein
MAVIKSMRPATKSVSKQVVQILNSRIERKLVTGATAGIDWSATGTVSEISTDIAQGDNINNRSGDVIRPIRLNFTIISRCIVAAASNVFRVILFQDTMANGAAPLVTDVLNTAVNYSQYKPINQQSKRFKILADFGGVNVNLANNQESILHKSVKLRGTTHYVGTSAGSTVAGKNSIYVLFISSNITAGSINYRWSYSLEFTDA